MPAELQPPSSGESSARNFFRSRSMLISIFLALGTIALFWPVHTFEFVGYDDPYYITGNPFVQHGVTVTGIQWAFTHLASQATYWHPLTWLSHMIDVELFGMNSGAHHLMNLFFHVVASILLFLLLNRLTSKLWPSAIVAALFAWHPIQVETVSWVTERKNILSTLFLFATIWTYVRFVEKAKRSPLEKIAVAEPSEPASETSDSSNAATPTPSKVDALLDSLIARLQWAFSFTEFRWLLAFYAMGLMCKPMLVTLPVLLLLLDFWPLDRVPCGEWRVARKAPQPQDEISSPSTRHPSLLNLIVEKFPLFVFAGVSSWITLAGHEQLQYFLPVSQIPVGTRVANVIITYVRYIEHIIFPANLCAIYPYSNTINTLQFGLATFLLVFISYLVFSRVRTRPYLSFGWLWFLISLLPVIGIVQVGAQAMADRFAYVPVIGLLIMVVFGAADLLQNIRSRTEILGSAAAVVLAASLVMSSRQISFWQNSFTLFNRVLAVTEKNPIAHYNLGMAYAARGQTQEAKSHFYQALRIAPSYVDAWNNYAAALLAEGKLDQAMQQYVEMARHNPKSSLAHYNLGALLDQQGNRDEALKEYKAALDCDPNNSEAHNNVGNALLRAGKIDEAAEHILTAVKLGPQNPQAQFSAGTILMRMQRSPEALQHFAEAVRLKPDYAEAHYQFGNALAMQGKFDQAFAHFSEAARLNPKAAELRIPVGMTATELGKVDEAVTAYREALRLKSDLLVAQVNLGWIFASAKDSKFRNGDEALRMANDLAEKTQMKDPSVLDLLAAAYAETGKFPQATEAAEKAMTLAEASGQKPLVAQIESHLKLYRDGKPFHLQ